MNSEELIISIVRIVGSIPVLFFPFWGSILAILVDLSDLFLMGFIKLGGVSNYQKLDKFLDLFYMSLFLIVSLRWDSREKFISIGLFAFRMLGVTLFFIFNIRIILVFFPNVFEFWFVLIAGYKYFNQKQEGYVPIPENIKKQLIDFYNSKNQGLVNLINTNKYPNWVQ